MSHRVLVAEDEAIIRLDLVETLTLEGYIVVGDCGRGTDAVRLAIELSPEIVLVDVRMPGLDGIAAARRITESTDAAVVMLTAFSQRELVDEAADAGAMAYLVKPYRRTDLVPTLELALARRREAAMLATRVDDLETQFEERKLVERAKGRLMDDRGLGEAEALRFLQRSAMSTRRRMVDVADEVLRGNPG